MFPDSGLQAPAQTYVREPSASCRVEDTITKAAHAGQAARLGRSSRSRNSRRMYVAAVFAAFQLDFHITAG